MALRAWASACPWVRCALLVGFEFGSCADRARQRCHPQMEELHLLVASLQAKCREPAVPCDHPASHIALARNLQNVCVCVCVGNSAPRQMRGAWICTCVTVGVEACEGILTHPGASM